MREDASTIAAIRAGDPQVLEEVARACLPGLLRAARAAGLGSDRAQDAVQESLLVFVQRAGDFDGRARPCTWIHGILMKKVWEGRRRAEREMGQEPIDQVMERRFDAAGSWVRPPQGPMEALARGKFQAELAACLDDLGERQRVAFVLREVEGFTTDEICNVLDVTANNLGVLLFRARNGLRECLEAKGFEGSSDAAL